MTVYPLSTMRVNQMNSYVFVSDTDRIWNTTSCNLASRRAQTFLTLRNVVADRTEKSSSVNSCLWATASP